MFIEGFTEEFEKRAAPGAKYATEAIRINSELSKREGQVFAEQALPIPKDQNAPAAFAIQRHDALRAGPHLDLRLLIGDEAHSWATRKGLPTEPGRPRLLIQQPTHRAEYASWQGTIPEGEYGAGEVTLDELQDIVIKSSDNDKIHFFMPKGNNPGEFTMFRKDGANWLAVKHKPRAEYFERRQKYRNKGEVPPEAWTSRTWIAEEKKDGAGTIAVLDKNKGISFISARESISGLPIHRTWNVPHLDVKVPPEYHGTVLRGETWHPGGFYEASRILNSAPTKAVMLQLEKGLLNFAPFKVERAPGGEKIPYSEQRKFIEKLTRDLGVPYIQPPGKQIIGDKQKLLNKVIGEGGEGIILKPLDSFDEKDWFKVKNRNDWDLRIVGTTEGRNKYRGRGIGAFILADRTGRVVGRAAGMPDEIREEAYLEPENFIGQIAKIKSQGVAVSQLRAPVFKGFSTDTVTPDVVLSKI